MKTPFEQKIKLTFEVEFGKAPEYNATYTLSRSPSSASFEYGNHTCVHVLIEYKNEKKEAELYDTRYDHSVSDFDKWCANYFKNRFDSALEPTVKLGRRCSVIGSAASPQNQQKEKI